MKTTRKISKGLENKVLAINEAYELAENQDLMVYAYFGSTYPYLINTNCPITVKNQFVYITVDDKRTRYNANNAESLEDLKYELRHIFRAVKQELNNA